MLRRGLYKNKQEYRNSENLTIELIQKHESSFKRFTTHEELKTTLIHQKLQNRGSVHKVRSTYIVRHILLSVKNSIQGIHFGDLKESSVREPEETSKQNTFTSSNQRAAAFQVSLAPLCPLICCQHIHKTSRPTSLSHPTKAAESPHCNNSKSREQLT